ncbi:MAG: hypothetical protein ACP5IX_01800 [Patescibacteria group bacterium]
MKKTILISLLVSLTLVGASCVKVKVAAFDGGVFKSIDKGLSWQQKVALLGIGQPKTIAGVNVSFLTFSPHDSNVLYLGTKENGLFVSYNGGDSWQGVEKLPRSTINAVAPDPKLKHIVYVGIGGRIFKSIDCCQNWQNIYLEAVSGVEVTSLAVDPVDNSKILAGLSDGRLLRSVNGGSSWSTLYDFRAKIKQILINPKNAQIIYVNTQGTGLWRSSNGGVDWQNLDEPLKKYPGGRDIEWIIFDQNKDDAIVTSSSYGLLRSDNGGQEWFDYKLLLQPGRMKISAFAFNPNNPNEIYYSTATTFYRSFDGGRNWQTKSLPSKRVPVFMLVDPNNPSVIYLGVMKIEK